MTVPVTVSTSAAFALAAADSPSPTLTPRATAAGTATAARARRGDAFCSSGQSPGDEVVAIGDLPLAGGGLLPGARVAVALRGPLDAPVVVVLGGISAGRDVATWWAPIVGAQRAIDVRQRRVLSIDWLGGVGGSTRPAPGAAFPAIATQDQASAIWRVCDRLRITRLDALIGSSYGGMVALQAARLAPERVRHLGVLAAAHRSHPEASAWRFVQRQIAELGARAGRGDDGNPRAGVALARSLAMLGYRTAAELGRRFTGGPDDLELQGWLRARGEAFAATWSPESFLCLNRSIDAHRIDPDEVRVPTFLLAFASDRLVPPRDVRDLAAGLPQLRLHRVVHTRYGHDGFLKEPRRVAAFVREVLR